MIPLVVRSHYSFGRGTASPAVLCRTARRMGYRRLALTDTDNLCGLWPFLDACAREGLTPIVGAEVTQPDGAQKLQAVCLVQDAGGYTNLCRLLTRRHLEKGFHLPTALTELGGGLTILGEDPALLAAVHQAGHTAAAMTPRPLPAAHPLRQAARHLGLALVAVPDSVMITPADRDLHRLLRAIDANLPLSRVTENDLAPEDAWLAPPAEYRRRFAVLPRAVDAGEALAEALVFTGPRFGVVLPPWRGPDGRSAVEWLREAAYAGARRRYGEDLSEAVVERLAHELAVIDRMGFSPYFLVVRDIVAASPRTCGRGSGAASLVAYCLGITNVCPMRYNLYFGRFLNPGRTDPPDIDVDFAWDERDRVIAGVLEQWGIHAAMVSSHIAFQPRMAVRETARAFGLTEAEIGRVTRRLPWAFRSAELAEGDLAEALGRRPESRHLDFPAPWPEILDLSRRLIGIPRHLSVHSGGVVITPSPIDHYAPVQRAPKGVPILQWEKDGVEAAGLVKIDLLGNRSLAVIRDAVAGVRAAGIAFDETRWVPEDDFDTREALAQGRTMGCFYIESPAMRLLQQKAAVGDFEHLVIHSSIIRPAANDCIRQYLQRLHGAPWQPLHPALAGVLDDTFGMLVYQEDVSLVAMALAGFSDAEADRLRKVMSKKDRDHVLADFHQRFVAGARTRGVDERVIAAVWDQMTSFSGYSFCKPHSASYARVSFQAAYLKVHHPAAFMAAVISNQGGFYTTFAYVSEARRIGLTVQPPDVNRSDVGWTGSDDQLRVGLASVAGLSTETAQRIVAGRRDRPYRGPEDFFHRARPSADEARALIAAGALDPLAPGAARATLSWSLARWLRRQARGPVPGRLFEDDTGEALPDLPPDDPLGRLRREYAVLGFLCDRHPMTLLQDRLRSTGRIPAADLPRYAGCRVCVAGWLITGKVVRTKRGEPMEFLTFEDETGTVEATFFPRAYDRYGHLLETGRPYLLWGQIDRDWAAVTLTAERVAGIR
ncbi:MAG: DNA polymerase III subunit alpha [Desulfosarcinaceae bacterium]